MKPLSKSHIDHFLEAQRPKYNRSNAKAGIIRNIYNLGLKILKVVIFYPHYFLEDVISGFPPTHRVS